MDTAAPLPAGATAAYDALCTALGVKAPFRILHSPELGKPHICIKRDTPKDGEPDDVDPNCARFVFVANKRINVNKGAVLHLGIERPTPEGVHKPWTPNLDAYLLEATLIGAEDEEEEVPKVAKEGSSVVKRARRQARKNMVALPPKMRKSLGQKLPNMYYAAAHELMQTPPMPAAPSDAHIPRVFATTAVQTETPPLPFPPPPTISITLNTPLCDFDESETSPVQLPSPVSADHARDLPPSGSAAPLEDENSYHYDMERSLSPMDLESGSSSPEASPVMAQAALPEEDVAPIPQVLPGEEVVLDAIADEALPPSRCEETSPPSRVAVSSDSTGANLLETPLQSLPAALTRSASPPRLAGPELHSEEMSRPMEDIIESVPEVEIKREQIQSADPLVPPDDDIRSSNSPAPISSDATEARLPIETPTEPRFVRQVGPSPWATGRAAPTFLKSTLTSSWDQIAQPYLPTPTMNNPLGIRPSANAAALSRAPPTGPRSLLSTATTSSAPKKPVVVGAKWTASRGAAQNAGAQSGALSTSSSITSVSSSSGMSLASSQPTSPVVSSSASPPMVPKADKKLSAIVGYASPSPPPEPVAPPPPPPSQSPPIAKATVAQPPPPAPPLEAPTASKWKRIDGSNGWSSLSTLPTSLPPNKAITTPTIPTVQPVLVPVTNISTSFAPPPKTSTPTLLARTVSNPLPGPTSTSSTPAPAATSSLPPASASTLFTPALRPPTIPLPCKPMSIAVLPTLHRPASVLVVPASFQNNTSRSVSTPSTSHSNPSSSSNIARIPSTSHTPAISSSLSSSSSNAMPLNPRKRPYEASMIPPVVVKVEPTSPVSFFKMHLPRPASSQMATMFSSGSRSPSVGGDLTNTENNGTGKGKKKRTRRGNKWKGEVEDGQLLAKDPGHAADAGVDWPTTVPKLKHRLVPNMNPPPGASAFPGVKKIMLSEDGTRVALLCEDHTLRIWLNETAGVAPGEIARLNHKQSLVTACWMDNRRILVVTRDGVVLMWTRSVNGKEEWNPLRLFTLPEVGVDDAQYCLAYSPDRIAISVPSGVKIWMFSQGKWQQQRDIIRGGVTAIKFVFDGAGLIGGCRDGVIWYCEVPNGTLRAYAFISQRRAIESIDVNSSGKRMLVTQEGGRAYLISLNQHENRGTIERTYTSEKFHNFAAGMFPGVFAMRGQTVLYGYIKDCVPIWNRKKGTIVYGLRHNKGDVVQAAATFDDPSGVGGSMITGTSKGELFWWPPPEVHESSSHVDTDDVSRKRQRVG